MDAQLYFKVMSEDFMCDCCEKKTVAKNKRYLLNTRPSDPTELVAIMWTCPKCASSVGAMTVKACEKYREENGYLFLTL